MEITQIDIISWMERIFFATISLVFVAVALKRRTVTWRWQKYQNSAPSLLLGDATNNFSSNSAVNWPMFGKNYWLTKCFVFTTNFEPIVKQSVANNTLLSQILVKKPIYFYILDLYFRTGKNRVLDLYFRTEGVILRNFYQIELSIVKRFSSLLAIGNARNVEGTCSISTWNVLLIFGDEMYSWRVFF